jgi:phosphatidylserine decarboxylase
MSPAFRESLPFLIPLVIAWLIFTAMLALWSEIISVILFVLILYVFFFFRDPEREPQGDDQTVVAAADGLVVGVDEVEDIHFQHGKMKRVSIFLSVFDVHVNRAPVAGTVRRTIHEPGKFLDVRHPDASAMNEYLAWWLETPRGPVVVRQIAGLIARRIVAWVGEGDALTRGQRFGMIRFGSRTEVYLPLTCRITVQVGDRVQGGHSAIATWS